MRLLFLLIFFSLTCHSSQADDGRYRTSFSSSNKAFSLKLENNSWYLRNVKGDTLYSIKDSGYTSQTIFVSNNGERLVIIDDYIITGFEVVRPALKFYQKGQLIKSYGLYDLISSHCFCTYSVSHTRWVLDDFSLSKNEDTFSLATYDFYEYQFNIDGALLKKQRPSEYNDSTSIVYGDYHRIAGSRNTYQMKVKAYVAGAKYQDDKVQFTAKRLSKQSLDVFMIANGIDVTPKRYRLNSIIFNLCHEHR